MSKSRTGAKSSAPGSRNQDSDAKEEEELAGIPDKFFVDPQRFNPYEFWNCSAGALSDYQNAANRAVSRTVDQHYKGFNTSSAHFSETVSLFSRCQDRMHSLRAELDENFGRREAAVPSLGLFRRAITLEYLVARLNRIEHLRTVCFQTDVLVSQGLWAHAGFVVATALARCAQPDLSSLPAVHTLRRRLIRYQSGLRRHVLRVLVAALCNTTPPEASALCNTTPPEASPPRNTEGGESKSLQRSSCVGVSDNPVPSCVRRALYFHLTAAAHRQAGPQPSSSEPTAQVSRQAAALLPSPVPFPEMWRLVLDLSALGELRALRGWRCADIVLAVLRLEMQWAAANASFEQNDAILPYLPRDVLQDAHPGLVRTVLSCVMAAHLLDPQAGLSGLTTELLVAVPAMVQHLCERERDQSEASVADAGQASRRCGLVANRLLALLKNVRLLCRVGDTLATQCPTHDLSWMISHTDRYHRTKPPRSSLAERRRLRKARGKPSQSASRGGDGDSCGASLDAWVEDAKPSEDGDGKQERKVGSSDDATLLGRSTVLWHYAMLSVRRGWVCFMEDWMETMEQPSPSSTTHQTITTGGPSSDPVRLTGSMAVTDAVEGRQGVDPFLDYLLLLQATDRLVRVSAEWQGRLLHTAGRDTHNDVLRFMRPVLMRAVSGPDSGGQRGEPQAGAVPAWSTEQALRTLGRPAVNKAFAPAPPTTTTDTSSNTATNSAPDFRFLLFDLVGDTVGPVQVHAEIERICGMCLASMAGGSPPGLVARFVAGFLRDNFVPEMSSRAQPALRLRGRVLYRMRRLTCDLHQKPPGSEGGGGGGEGGDAFRGSSAASSLSAGLREASGAPSASSPSPTAGLEPIDTEGSLRSVACRTSSAVAPLTLCLWPQRQDQASPVDSTHPRLPRALGPFPAAAVPAVVSLLRAASWTLQYACYLDRWVVLSGHPDQEDPVVQEEREHLLMFQESLCLPVCQSVLEAVERALWPRFPARVRVLEFGALAAPSAPRTPTGDAHRPTPPSTPGTGSKARPPKGAAPSRLPTTPAGPPPKPVKKKSGGLFSSLSRHLNLGRSRKSSAGEVDKTARPPPSDPPAPSDTPTPSLAGESKQRVGSASLSPWSLERPVVVSSAVSWRQLRRLVNRGLRRWGYVGDERGLAAGQVLCAGLPDAPPSQTARPAPAQPPAAQWWAQEDRAVLPAHLLTGRRWSGIAGVRALRWDPLSLLPDPAVSELTAQSGGASQVPLDPRVFAVDRAELAVQLTLAAQQAQTGPVEDTEVAATPAHHPTAVSREPTRSSGTPAPSQTAGRVWTAQAQCLPAQWRDQRWRLDPVDRALWSFASAFPSYLPGGAAACQLRAHWFPQLNRYWRRSEVRAAVEAGAHPLTGPSSSSSSSFISLDSARSGADWPPGKLAASSRAPAGRRSGRRRSRSEASCPAGLSTLQSGLFDRKSRLSTQFVVRAPSDEAVRASPSGPDKHRDSPYDSPERAGSPSVDGTSPSAEMLSAVFGRRKSGAAHLVTAMAGGLADACLSLVQAGLAFASLAELMDALATAPVSATQALVSLRFLVVRGGLSDPHVTTPPAGSVRGGTRLPVVVSPMSSAAPTNFSRVQQSAPAPSSGPTGLALPDSDNPMLQLLSMCAMAGSGGQSSAPPRPPATSGDRGQHTRFSSAGQPAASSSTPRGTSGHSPSGQRGGGGAGVTDRESLSGVGRWWQSSPATGRCGEEGKLVGRAPGPSSEPTSPQTVKSSATSSTRTNTNPNHDHHSAKAPSSGSARPLVLLGSRAAQLRAHSATFLQQAGQLVRALCVCGTAWVRRTVRAVWSQKQRLNGGGFPADDSVGALEAVAGAFSAENVHLDARVLAGVLRAVGAGPWQLGMRWPAHPQTHDPAQRVLWGPEVQLRGAVLGGAAGLAAAVRAAVSGHLASLCAELDWSPEPDPAADTASKSPQPPRSPAPRNQGAAGARRSGVPRRWRVRWAVSASCLEQALGAVARSLGQPAAPLRSVLPFLGCASEELAGLPAWMTREERVLVATVSRHLGAVNTVEAADKE